MISKGSMDIHDPSDWIYPTVGLELFEAVKAKGPCTASEHVHRSVKEIYKKMTSLCQPVLREHMRSNPSASEFEQIKQYWVENGAIILQSKPLTIGMPPGSDFRRQFEEFEEDLDALREKILGADRTSNGKAVGAHNKLLHTAEQVKIILRCQRQQLRMTTLWRRSRTHFGQFLSYPVSRG